MAAPLDQHGRRRKLTYRLLTVARRNHRIMASRAVVNEIREIPNAEMRRAFARKLRRARPEMVPTQAAVEEIAQDLLARGGWAPRYLVDMMHIGYSVIGGADILVTWDVADLARERTRRIVAAMARERGMEAPDIATPAEVLEEWFGIRIP